MAVWTWTLRTFVRDESEDLSATMAALDTTLGRAHRMATWLARERAKDSEPDKSAVPDSADDQA